MRVRISYSIDLEEVPDEIAELLTKTSLELLLCGGLVNEIGKDFSTRTLDEAAVLKTLDEVRLKLSVADQTIVDSINLINGYFQAGKPPVETKEDVTIGQDVEVGEDVV